MQFTRVITAALLVYYPFAKADVSSIASVSLTSGGCERLVTSQSISTIPSAQKSSMMNIERSSASYSPRPSSSTNQSPASDLSNSLVSASIHRTSSTASSLGSSFRADQTLSLPTTSYNSLSESASFSTSSASPNVTLAWLSLTQRLRLAKSASDRYKLLPNDEQFKFNLKSNQSILGQSSIVVVNEDTFPALVSVGSSIAVGHVAPCGLIAAHHHQSTPEIQLVLEGRLVTEMILEDDFLDTANRRIVHNDIGPNELTIFYQGATHYQFNPDCTNTTFISLFSQEGSATESVLNTLSDSVDGSTVYRGIPSSMSQSVNECVQKCRY